MEVIESQTITSGCFDQSLSAEKLRETDESRQTASDIDVQDNIDCGAHNNYTTAIQLVFD